MLLDVAISDRWTEQWNVVSKLFFPKLVNDRDCVTTNPCYIYMIREQTLDCADTAWRNAQAG